MEIFKSLKESGILGQGISETINMKQKNKNEEHFFQ